MDTPDANAVAAQYKLYLNFNLKCKHKIRSFLKLYLVIIIYKLITKTNNGS